MAKPAITKPLKFLGGKLELETLRRAVTPEPAMIRHRLKALVKRYGVEGVACLVDVSPCTVTRWLKRSYEVGPTCRKLVWTVYGMIYAPHELATLFDYATYGRFTAAPLVVSKDGKPGDPPRKPRKRTPQGKFMPD